MRDATMQQASDLELGIRASHGDLASAALLARRHGDLESRLGDLRIASSPLTAAEVMACAERTARADLPLRAALLAHSVGEAAPERGGTIWTSFCSLPSASRLALWHREVEGHPTHRIAVHLAASVSETARTVNAAYVALIRAVAIHNEGDASNPECRKLFEHFRFSTRVRIDRRTTRALREHGRRCDSCLPLVRDLFTIEHNLGATLAQAALGSAGLDYVAGRPPLKPMRSDAVSARAGRPPRLRHAVVGVCATALGAAVLTPVLGLSFQLDPNPDQRVAAPAWPGKAGGERGRDGKSTAIGRERPSPGGGAEQAGAQSSALGTSTGSDAVGSTPGLTSDPSTSLPDLPEGPTPVPPQPPDVGDVSPEPPSPPAQPDSTRSVEVRGEADADSLQVEASAAGDAVSVTVTMGTHGKGRQPARGGAG
jgi:hypothetical protein